MLPIGQLCSCLSNPISNLLIIPPRHGRTVIPMMTDERQHPGKQAGYRILSNEEIARLFTSLPMFRPTRGRSLEMLNT